MSKPQKNVGRVLTRQAASACGDVGLHPQGVGRGCKGLKPQQHTLRDEAANPTYGDMAGEWREVTLQDAFEINPRRELKRGTVTPFIPMDALPEHSRKNARIDAREYTGSGTSVIVAFCPDDKTGDTDSRISSSM